VTKLDYIAAKLFVRPTVLCVLTFRVSCRELASYAIWLACIINFYVLAVGSGKSAIWIIIAIEWLLQILVGLLAIYLTIRVGRSPEDLTTGPSETHFRTLLVGLVIIDFIATMATQPIKFTVGDAVIPLILWHDYALIMGLPKPPKRQKRRKPVRRTAAAQA
jgi:hypothetical protein